MKCNDYEAFVFIFLLCLSPLGTLGFKTRIGPPYPHARRKRRLKLGGFSEKTLLKNPMKCLWRKEPDHRSNFFFSPPAHLFAVTYITEISLHVTLSNQSHSLTLLRLNFYPATD